MKVTIEINNILIIDEYSSCFPTMVGLTFSILWVNQPLNNTFITSGYLFFKHQLHRPCHAVLSVS